MISLSLLSYTSGEQLSLMLSPSSLPSVVAAVASVVAAVAVHVIVSEGGKHDNKQKTMNLLAHPPVISLSSLRLAAVFQ